MNSEGKSKGGMILGGIMIAIASLLVGGYGGAQLTATFLLNQALSKDARDVQKQVKALRDLQAGDQQAAIEILESRLDDDLILFDPQKPYEGLNEATKAGISNAIILAKEYRGEFPRQSKRRMVDEMVNHLFNKYP